MRIPIDEEAIKCEEEYQKEQKKLKTRIKKKISENTIFMYIKIFLLDFCLLNFVISLLCVIFPIVGIVLMCYLSYVQARWVYNGKNGDIKEHAWFYLAVVIFYMSVFTALMIYFKGNVDSVEMAEIMCCIMFPFVPLSLYAMFGAMVLYYVSIFCILLTKALTYALYNKKVKECAGVLALGGVLACISFAAYANSTNVKYAKQVEGHGFKYMNGYSSTDFTGYNVYDGEKLARLDHESSFIIENQEDMPVLDGAEACYPLYCAAAKAVYRDIDKIEEPCKNYRDNGKIVQFTNTVWAYDHLVSGDVDMVFGARPSAEQKSNAEKSGDRIVSVPIAKEAFVFFVEPDNPVDNLTSQQIRDIYSGKIKNWKELGGKNQKIIAFQRPENSGSQTMMQYFMGDTPLKEPLKYEKIGSMGDVIDKVVEYNNEKGAMGYSFRYFVEELQKEKNVKLLKIDGTAPTLENIENGTYPLCVDLVCAKLKSNNKENVKKMLEFLLSDDGKYLIRKTCYAPVENTEIIEIEETAK